MLVACEGTVGTMLAGHIVIVQKCGNLFHPLCQWNKLRMPVKVSLPMRERTGLKNATAHHRHLAPGAQVPVYRDN